MTFNFLLLIYILLTVFCVFRGLKKGLVGIVFSIIGWIFVLVFINIATPYIDEAIHNRTEVDEHINERLVEQLEHKYEISEEEEEGSGTGAVIETLPERIKNEVIESVNESIEMVIRAVAGELTDTAVHGIAIVIAIIIGAIVLHLLYQLLELIFRLPVLREINRLFGFFGGFLESTLIMWIMMFLADCFSATTIGGLIIDMSQSDTILSIIYSHNIIESIIGL